MTWEIFETSDLAACHALRREVFIVEQGVAEADEMDDLDEQAVHVLATVNGFPVGTTRLLQVGTTGKIGRICVVISQRGTGLGAALVRDGIERIIAKGGMNRIMLGAQEHAIGFYEKLGFTICGPTYDDAGIPHRDMEMLL